ncbi:MAG: porin, partial [Thiohalorhabdaceae bacterium]
MRNKLVAAAITGLVAAPGAHAAADVSWFGYNQITLEQQGENGNGNGSGFGFGADRIRIGYKAKFDNGAFSKLQVDFNRNLEDDRGGLPRLIKDATVGYDFGPANVQAGMRKTPVGMDFNTSGKKLDITKRGME